MSACVYCRRSRVECDGQRPCGTCERRDLGPLCAGQGPSFVSENVGSEFGSLNEFLALLEGTEETMSQPEEDQEVLGRRERFFLTAADPSTQMLPAQRLRQVLAAKLEAGLLAPHDYANGYVRLEQYCAQNLSMESQARIARPLEAIRPAFRAVRNSLHDVDLLLLEHAFERTLLSYDRVFASMSVPAALWRRTGELCRANKEFASLVGRPVDDLRDASIAIYELMSEASVVRYWEAYGAVAFDRDQKVLLWRCKIGGIECSCSITIRRDRYNLPLCIVGNFIPVGSTQEASVA